MIEKIAGGILILAAGGWLGASLSAAYRKRERGIEGLIYALRLMKTEIGFCESYVSDIYGRLGKALSGELAHTFLRAEALAREGVRAGESLARAVRESAPVLCLCSEEMRIIEEFARELGRSDRKRQTENIDRAILLLDEEKARAHAECAYRAKMRQSICLLGAALVVVLLL